MNEQLKKIALEKLAADQAVPVDMNSLDAIKKELHRIYNNPAFEQAHLGTIGAETGGTFDYRTWEKGKGKSTGPLDLDRKQFGGYGLYQLTGQNLTDYKAHLKKNRIPDSAISQLNWYRHNYLNRRSGAKDHLAGTAHYTYGQYADWLHQYGQTPRHYLKKHFNQKLISAYRAKQDKYKFGPVPVR